MAESKRVGFNAGTRAALTDVGLDLSPGEMPVGVRKPVEAVHWLTVPQVPANIPEETAMLVVRIERERVEDAIGISAEESLDYDAEAPSPQSVSYLGSLFVQGRGADGTIRQAYVAAGRQLTANFEERSVATAEREEPAMLEVGLRLGTLVRELGVTEVRFVYQDPERETPLKNALDTDPEWAPTGKYAVPLFDLTAAIPQNTSGTSA